jgi:dienelactone hydrolase
MRRTTLIIAVLAMSAVWHNGFSDHASLPKGVTPEMATWPWGYHGIPASITEDGSPYWYAYPHTDAGRINDPPWTEVAARHIKEGAKAPAVLYLHGCGGLIRGGLGYRLMLLNAGFAIFEPDAFARPGHTCEGSSIAQRRAEIVYALSRIRQLPWIDQDRIVLMGNSQGGWTVAEWSQPGFAAHVILASNCGRFRSNEGAAPGAPAGVPVLAVVGAKDNLYSGSSCHVTRRIGGSESIMIAGAGHDIMGHPQTKSAIDDFLRNCCQ